MYFQGPFLLLNEKNGHYFEINKLNIHTEYGQTCIIDFYIGQKNNNEYELNVMFYKDAIYNSINDRQGFCKGSLANYILYELVKENKNTYRKKKSLELKVGMITSYDSDESFCTVNFDYFIIESDSKLCTHIHNEQNLYQQEHNNWLHEERIRLNYLTDHNIHNVKRSIRESEMERKEKELDEIQNSWERFTPWGFWELLCAGRI